MAATNFPHGVNVGDAAGGTNLSVVVNAGVTSGQSKIAVGTVVLPANGTGTAFATGLTTVDYVVASPYSTVVGVAGFESVMASKSGGSITIIGISGAGTAATATGTATWLAVGS